MHLCPTPASANQHPPTHVAEHQKYVYLLIYKSWQHTLSKHTWQLPLLFSPLSRVDWSSSGTHRTCDTIFSYLFSWLLCAWDTYRERRTKVFSFDGSPPCNDIVEVIAVQEIMTRVTATHHQGYHRLIIASSTLCGNMLMNTLISTQREDKFVYFFFAQKPVGTNSSRAVLPSSLLGTSSSTWKYQDYQ